MKRAVPGTLCDIFWLLLVPRKCSYAIQPNPVCHRTSNLTDEVHLLRDYNSSVRVLSRNLERHVCLAARFCRIYTCKYVHSIILYHLPFLLLAVTPNLFPRRRRDGRLPAAYSMYYCAALQLTAQHDVA